MVAFDLIFGALIQKYEQAVSCYLKIMHTPLTLIVRKQDQVFTNAVVQGSTTVPEPGLCSTVTTSFHSYITRSLSSRRTVSSGSIPTCPCALGVFVF